jgi:PKD repeat protein
MKKILYLIAILPLFFVSCESSHDIIPVAQFHIDATSVEVGKDIYFTNDSRNASTYKWDFGDGYISSEADPVHVYTATGPYEVTLTATSISGQEDHAALSFTVKIPTLLEIEVRENNDNMFAVNGASVILYPTLNDWDNQTNMVAEGITDAYGIVVFSNLDPIVYYVDVWEQTHDNWALGAASADWIRTSEVMPNVINRYVAWVDVVIHGKGIVPVKKNMVIKRIENKTIVRSQPSDNSSTEGWQQLYDKSIRKK